MKTAMIRAGRFHYAWVVILTSCAVVFGCLGLGRFGYGILLPEMQSELHMDNTGAGLVASADLVAYLAMALASGMLAARVGSRIVISAGLACGALGMILTGAAPGIPAILAARVLTGLGGGAANVPVMGILAAWTTKRRRGLAAGIAVAGSSLGLISLGPAVPRLLAALGPGGWRTVWFIFGGVTSVIAALAAALLRNSPGEVGRSPMGSVEDGPTPPGPPSRRWRDVYRSPYVWHLGLVYIAFGFSYIIYMTFFIKRLVSEGGYSPAEAGRLFMIMGWCSLVCGVLWGAVSDRIGRKWALAAIYLIHALAFAVFGIAQSHGAFLVSAVLFGLSAWSIPAVMAAACGDVTGPRLAPAALGFVTLFFGAGQVLGPTAAGALTDAFGNFTPAFLTAAGVALLGAAAAALIRENIRVFRQG